MSKGLEGRLKLGWILAGVFAFAMILGAGPGILFVNQPEMWFGLPRLYVWGMFWCTVEIAVVVVAYVFVWRTNDEASK
jgi:hypothetical protein